MAGAPLASSHVDETAGGGLEEAPAVVAALFGERVALLERYVDLLAGEGVRRGLLGPRELPRLWSRHVLNCVVVADLLPVGAAVGDLGSGAGLPGIVLALARPDLHVTLIEPLLRRTVFLTEVLDSLGLSRVVVTRARAEDVAGQVRFDVVTAHAVAPLARLVPWALPLLPPGGELLALKGRSAEAELTEALPAVRAAGAVSWRVEEVGQGVVDPPTAVVRVRAGQVPRNGGMRRGPRPQQGQRGAVVEGGL